MSKKKKPRSRKIFIEGMDSYCDEYEFWKKTTNIKRLVGVFEMPEEQFCLGLEDLLASAGLGHYRVVRYTSEYDNTPSGSEPISGTGCAVAVRDVYGRIAPVVFVRSDVQSVGDGNKTIDEHHPQFGDSVRLLVLMHELGHADDIAKGVNYDHKELKINFAAAEAYTRMLLYAGRLKSITIRCS